MSIYDVMVKNTFQFFSQNHKFWDPKIATILALKYVFELST